MTHRNVEKGAGARGILRLLQVCVVILAVLACAAPHTGRLSLAPAGVARHACGLPDPRRTPGALCSRQDPNFDEVRYPAKVAHCARNITMAEKELVAGWYGVPKRDFARYEFDHYIPLAAGGSNDPRNLWPQVWPDAHDKDKVEAEVYRGLRDGSMTQRQAVARIRAWRPEGCR